MEASPMNSSGSKKREKSRRRQEVKNDQREVSWRELNARKKAGDVSEQAQHKKAGIAKFFHSIGCLFLAVGYLMTVIIMVIFLYAVFQTLALLWTTGIVTMHDNARVLNVRKLQQEGGREFNPVTITTTNFEGPDAGFDAQALHNVSDANTIYVAIDVAHRHLVIVGGSKVSLGDNVYQEGVDVFRKNIHGNDYTLATLAVLHMLHDETISSDISFLVFFSIIAAICLGVWLALHRLHLLPKFVSDGSSSSSDSWGSSSSSSYDGGGDSGGHSGFASGHF